MEQEAHLSEKPPEVVGVALILPAPQDVVASMAGMESDPAVEKIAVDIVMQYEVDQGRKPVSVEEENCGWDVTSLHGGQVARYIDRKGLRPSCKSRCWASRSRSDVLGMYC